MVMVVVDLGRSSFCHIPVLAGAAKMTSTITARKAEARHILTHSQDFTPSLVKLAWRFLRQHRNKESTMQSIK